MAATTPVSTGGSETGRRAVVTSHRALYPKKFHAAIRIMSRGLFESWRTAEASNPECIAQFWQRASWRDSQ
jgi:hypothetical protein